MGCMDKESCPELFLKNLEDWQIHDPKGKSIEEVRESRDQTEQKVKDFVVSMTKEESI